MSNDAKFWAARVGLVAAIVLNLFVLSRMLDEVRRSALGEAAHFGLWLAIWIFTLVLAMGVGLLCVVYRNRRWKSVEHKTAAQIEIETLNALAQSENRNPKDTPGPK